MSGFSLVRYGNRVRVLFSPTSGITQGTEVRNIRNWFPDQVYYVYYLLSRANKDCVNEVIIQNRGYRYIPGHMVVPEFLITFVLVVL